MHPELTSSKRCIKNSEYQELRVKSEDLFWRNIYFRESTYLLRKFQVIFVRKNFVPRLPHGLNHLCLLTLTSSAKKYDGW